jgi:putative FmdB family regulatory protein
MPVYDFECGDCRSTFERLQPVAAPEPKCPHCGGQHTRRTLLSAPAVHGSAAGGRDHAVRSLPTCGKGCRCCP